MKKLNLRTLVAATALPLRPGGRRLAISAKQVSGDAIGYLLLFGVHGAVAVCLLFRAPDAEQRLSHREDAVGQLV
jgi:hypothetical protein